MSDEELDNLFRKSVDSFDPPYDPEAWHAMEQKLDRIGGGHWWSKVLFPLLILVYICSMVADTRQSSAPLIAPASQITALTENKPTEERQPALRSVAQKEEQLQTENKKSPVEVPAAQKDITAHLSSVEPGTVEKYTNTSSKRLSEQERKQFNFTTEAPMTAAPEEQLKLSAAPPSIAQDTTALAAILKQKEPDTVTLPAAYLTADSAHLQTSEVTESATAEDTSLREALQEPHPFMSRLQITVLVAPDLTTVKFKNPDAVSANAGLLLGIPVSKRLSLVTGAIWANKVYGAKPEDYSPSSGYWNSAYLPASIDATCRVLDIPLNLRYQVLEWRKNSIAVQAGLSSYLMLKEKYTYNYATYSKEVGYTNEYRHLFGVQNLSVSYARKVAPGISVGVEPFIKVPLTGIGAGHVKLSSAGIFFSAGYTLQLKK